MGRIWAARSHLHKRKESLREPPKKEYASVIKQEKRLGLSRIEQRPRSRGPHRGRGSQEPWIPSNPWHEAIGLDAGGNLHHLALHGTGLVHGMLFDGAHLLPIDRREPRESLPLRDLSWLSNPLATCDLAIGVGAGFYDAHPGSDTSAHLRL